ncbi:hypothetical protein VNO78_16095 [Psophocarpus tetragonolobus]|uniref:Uncharacterized protein n=1 Tax=Psophocarpus tetragonolobus TaxID=3891 RepID=A0AAN9XKD1_PSOTE
MRPDSGGDRVSRAQIAAEIAFRSTAQIPADLGAFGSFSATCSSSSPSPSSGSTAALRIVPDPVGSWHFGASRAACSTAVPLGLPLAKIPSALVRRRSRREGGNTASAGSAQEPYLSDPDKASIAALEMKNPTSLFAVFLLCAFTSATANNDVLLDINGEEVVNGGWYFMVSVMRPGGGITALQSENEICPITVSKLSLWGSGLPVEFSTPLAILNLREVDYLTVRFPLVPWCAPTPSQWTVLEGSKEVKLTGYNETVSGKFKVKHVSGTDYSLYFCSSASTCEPVGGPSFGGIGNLVVGPEANDMRFMFKKFTGQLGEVPLAMKDQVSEK